MKARLCSTQHIGCVPWFRPRAYGFWCALQSVRGSVHRFKSCAGLCRPGRMCACVTTTRLERAITGMSARSRRRTDSPTPDQLLSRFLAGCRSMETGMTSVTLSIASQLEVVSRSRRRRVPRRGAGRAHLVRLGWPAFRNTRPRALARSRSNDRPRSNCRSARWRAVAGVDRDVPAPSTAFLTAASRWRGALVSLRRPYEFRLEGGCGPISPAPRRPAAPRDGLPVAGWRLPMQTRQGQGAAVLFPAFRAPPPW